MKKFKKIIFMAIFTFIIAVQTISTNALGLSELESGIYDIKNEIYHEQEIGMSMARSYLDEDMILEKQNNKWYYTLTFSGANYMENHRILIDGKEVELEIIKVDDNKDSINLRFETTKIKPSLSTKIYVEPMERDVEFEIIPKEETLKLVKVIKEESKQIDPIEKNSKYNKLNIFAYIGLILVTIILLVILKKVKK